MAMVSTNSFAKTTDKSWYSGTFNSYMGLEVKIDTCVVVTEMYFDEIDANSYDVWTYCSDYADMVAVKRGQASRIPVYPVSFGNLSRSSMKQAVAYEDKWKNWRMGNVWSVTSQYYGRNNSVVRAKLKEADVSYRASNSYYGYLTTLDKLQSGDY